MSNANRTNKDSIIAVISSALLLLSLLPILFISYFDYATGDDLGYGAPGRAVLRSGGNALDFIKAAYSDTVREYYSWGGNWASGFLHRFEPSIFGERFYGITVIAALIALTLPSFFLLKELLVRRAGMRKSAFVTIYSLMTIILIQYMPAPKGGIFWFTGMTVYTLAFGFSLAALLLAIYYTDTGRLVFLIPCCLLTLYIGGSGYPEFVLSAMSMFFLSVYTLFLRKKQSAIKRGLVLIIPLLTLCASFIISAISPGNALRSGAEGLSPGPERLINTITGSLLRGLTDPVSYISHTPLIMVFIILTIVFTFETFDAENKTRIITFRYPYLLIPALYLTYSFTYAPEIYAGSNVASGFSGGVYDTYFYTFMICLTLAVIYLTGGLKILILKRTSSPEKRRLPEFRVILFLLGGLACLLLSGRLFDDTVDYTCIKFALSGQLMDFDSQMQERISILSDPSAANAVVPEMNDSQGPFMHMPLLSDPTAFTNLVTAEFYGKDTVTALPRDEFYREYSGQP